MVFQGAMNALNPVVQIGRQLEDVFEVHRPEMNRRQRLAEVKELLELVKVGEQRIRSYPHELSGGMRQRVMIAMALALRPQLMVMDEPTTALDVLVQREILRQISQLRREFGFSVIFITHDLPLLLEISDRIAIMKDGEIVELATAERIWNDPRDEYTRTLLSSFPRLTGEKGCSVRRHSRVRQCHQDLQRARRGDAQGARRRELHAFLRADHRPCRPVRKRQVDDREDPHPARTGNLRRSAARRLPSPDADGNCAPTGSSSAWSSRTRSPR